jgi:hypothetical protein
LWKDCATAEQLAAGWDESGAAAVAITKSEATFSSAIAYTKSW